MKPSLDPWEPRPAEGDYGDIHLYGGPWPKRQRIATVYRVCPKTGTELPLVDNLYVMATAPQLLDDARVALWWLHNLHERGYTKGIPEFDAAKLTHHITVLTDTINLARGRSDTTEAIVLEVGAEATRAARRAAEANTP